MTPACYAYLGACLIPLDAGITPPADAREAAAPFAPLVFLTRRDPRIARGVYAVSNEAELFEEEGLHLLLPVEDTPSRLPAALSALLAKEGASVLNTAFPRCYAVLERLLHPQARPRLTLVGLGDVGATVLTGLKLLGTELAEIGIFDPNAALCARYEMELNQVLPVGDAPLPPVRVRTEAELFDCDALLFTASRGVPPLTEKTGDVRMVQFGANRAMLAGYARMARERGFTGLFAQISDPVDQLSRAVFLDSNTNGSGEFDAAGLLPEQVQGYGLGVMRARAEYAARRAGVPTETIRAFGPHGQGLVIANAALDGYDNALSQALTESAATANLRVRELGFKPYIAPGLSSACASVLRTLRGEWHDGAVPLGGVYFGCRTRFTPRGLALDRAPLAQGLCERLSKTYSSLKEFPY